jgi:ABC-type nitrate/sulfonate/bicarbonate transport system permease component
VLRLTLLTSAVASGTFVATLAFAPSVINVGKLVGFGQTEIVRQVAAPAAAPGRICRTPLDKIIAALQHDPCS